MRVIHKFPLQAFHFDYGEWDIPLGEVVAVGFQNGLLHVWIERAVNSVSQMRLRVVPTGKEFDDEGLLHVGSAISDGYVWHVYRVF